MKTRFVVLITLLCVNACVKAPVYKGENYALIRSSHAIISINGTKVESKHSLDLLAGENTLVVLYPTYRHRYNCQFEWTSKPGTTYEITDQENKYPLTLYRWKRQNGLWASRLDPVDPVKCSLENEEVVSEPVDSE